MKLDQANNEQTSTFVMAWYQTAINPLHKINGNEDLWCLKVISEVAEYIVSLTNCG